MNPAEKMDLSRVTRHGGAEKGFDYHWDQESEVGPDADGHTLNLPVS